MSFILAAVGVELLVGYMFLMVIGLLPAYAWIGFGGIGLVMAVGGIWSFYR